MIFIVLLSSSFQQPKVHLLQPSCPLNPDPIFPRYFECMQALPPQKLKAKSKLISQTGISAVVIYLTPSVEQTPPISTLNSHYVKTWTMDFQDPSSIIVIKALGTHAES
ncbi:hypothetical protein J1N35_013817 [Gossypium stocksii]|uniref:Uncharacterized protein n=1 Tax=Gossypium stocksii TaxID=47602 RepID=A0A9D3VUJ7_9ROSI|nr:hypothetical protein J1N35_013817 [Gossypium stocksii]